MQHNTSKKMDESPLISVIIPAYNAKDYLRECLDSVCNQSYSNLEIICINDGSTDNTQQIMQDYAQQDPRITVISQQNQGLSVSRNNGVERAQGAYIFFLDSDDTIEPNAIETLYKRAHQTQTDIVICNLNKIDSSDGKKNNYQIWKRIDSQGTIHEQEEMPLTFSTKDILNYVFITECYVWNKLYKTEFIKKHNIKFMPKIIYEDIVYFTDIILAHPQMSYCNQALYNYRLRDDSLCHKTDKKQLDIFKVFETIEKKLKGSPEEEKLKSNLYHMKKYIYTWIYVKIPEENKKDYKQRIKKELKRKDYNRFLEITENVKIKDFFLFKIIKKNKKA